MNRFGKVMAYIVCILFIFSGIPFSFEPFTDASNLTLKGVDSWTTYQHDVQHTGRSNYYISGAYVKVKWEFGINGSIYQPVIDEYGNIYVVAGKFWEIGGYVGTLYSFSPVGTVRWKINLSSPAPPAIGGDGFIYVPCDDGLYAISTNNGTVGWIFKTDSWINNAAPVVHNGVIYLTSSEWCVAGTNAHLYAIYINGTLKWDIGLTGKSYVSPAIGHDGTIYVPSGENLYAISPEGNIKWVFNTDSNIAQSTPVVGPSGTIYIASSWLFAISPDGKLKWKYRLDPKRYDFGRPPAIDDYENLYVPSNGSIICISSGGKMRWSFKTASNDIKSPVIDEIGIIYVAADKVYALYPNGTVKWYISGKRWYSAVAIGNNSLYVYNGTLWAFRGFSDLPRNNTDNILWHTGVWLYVGVISTVCVVIVAIIYMKKIRIG